MAFHPAPGCLPRGPRADAVSQSRRTDQSGTGVVAAQVESKDSRSLSDSQHPFIDNGFQARPAEIINPFPYSKPEETPVLLRHTSFATLDSDSQTDNSAFPIIEQSSPGTPHDIESPPGYISPTSVKGCSRPRSLKIASDARAQSREYERAYRRRRSSGESDLKEALKLRGVTPPKSFHNQLSVAAEMLRVDNQLRATVQELEAKNASLTEHLLMSKECERLLREEADRWRDNYTQLLLQTQNPLGHFPDPDLWIMSQSTATFAAEGDEFPVDDSDLNLFGLSSGAS